MVRRLRPAAASASRAKAARPPHACAARQRAPQCLCAGACANEPCSRQRRSERCLARRAAAVRRGACVGAGRRRCGLQAADRPPPHLGSPAPPLMLLCGPSRRRRVRVSRARFRRGAPLRCCSWRPGAICTADRPTSCPLRRPGKMLLDLRVRVHHGIWGFS